MLSTHVSIIQAASPRRHFGLERAAVRAAPRRVVAPRAQIDLTTTWPQLRETLSTGVGFTMLAALAQSAITSLPSKKTEHLAETGRPMKPMEQFSFLTEKAIPEGVTGTLIGIAAALYMSQAGLAPSEAWTAAILTGAGARGAWWLRFRS